MNPNQTLKGSRIRAAVRLSLLASAAVAASFPYTSAVAAEEVLEEVTVTGSLLRRTDEETPSPITILTQEVLEERGINTVAEAIQRLPSNNAGTITAGWNTGFNFASGATAPALRGLTVQSTLSVADGLRMAPYPLADDGQRNFVDLNTIPSAIVERLEVLRDGASSTYGADAIAGVVNVITKKEIQGFHVNASYGISQEGDGNESHVDGTWGIGDLQSDGYNFYVAAEYQKQDALFAHDRGYPFNSMDMQGICGPSGSCLPNLNWNGVTAEDGLIHVTTSIPGISLVRPIASPTASAAAGTVRYQYLNPAAGCRNWESITITPDQSAILPLTACEVNFQDAYIMMQPEVERMGASARFTINIGDQAQAYAMANWYETNNFASFTPLAFNGTTPPPGGVGYNVDLPIYVCASGVGTLNAVGTGCDATNGTLNPQNPFAGDGQRAQLLLRSTRGRTDETTSTVMRGALGLTGSFGDDWRYTADFTASENKLVRDQSNYFVPQRVMDAAARGSFNFMDLEANSQEAWDTIAPPSSVESKSKLWQVQATIAKDLFDLAGGPLQAALGVAYRDESIVAPSGNPANDAAPYERYLSINAVGTSGSRDVTSGFFEVNAPVLTQLELTASGRFDDYSTGQSNFSPKLGFKVTPIEGLAIRGTWSEGFRIPSFNEAFGLPTTGYVTRTVSCTAYAAYCASHGGPTAGYNTAPYSLGLTQTGNPALDPEESTSYTLGLIVEPMSNVSLTIDFWRIEVENLIVGVTDTSEAESQYYLNNGVVNIPGFVAVPGVPDPAFPNALPVLGFIQSSFSNQDSQTVSGIDFGASVTAAVSDGIQLRSTLDVSYLAKYELDLDSGDTLSYAGTLSPCNITSCSGAPDWRASWQNTLDFGATTVSLTAYYTSGYDTASVDFGATPGDCLGNIDYGSTTYYVDESPQACHSKDVWNADLTVRHQFNDKVTIYADILNVFGIDAPFDHAAAYGLFNFNPSWAGPNMMGRYFRLGAKMDF